MQCNKNDQKSGNTRRTFLKETAALAVGLSVAGRAGANPVKLETLALNGGPKAVKTPPDSLAWERCWPLYGREEQEAVLEIARTPWGGPDGQCNSIPLLEEEWKEHFKVPYARVHSSGTAALMSLYFALDLPPGSEIMVPSYTYWATIVPMRFFGLVPVFVDINPRTLNLDLEDAQRRLTKNTKAVMTVHWIGLPCPMDQICDWAKEKGLIVLEDVAHAPGCSVKGKYTGTWGSMSMFSFQAIKPLPAGEGGMGVYQNKEYCERATIFGNYIHVPESFWKGSPYENPQSRGASVNHRIHPMAAALARCQLRGLEERHAKVVANVRSLNERLTQLPGLYEQAAPRPDLTRLYYLWNMFFINEAEAGMSREACVKALQAEGVRTWLFSYQPQHKRRLYAEAKWWHHKPVIPDLPGTEQANRTAIPLPVFTRPAPDVVDQYVKAFEKVWAHRKQLG